MWLYSQSTGELRRDGLFVGRGYSGREEGLNNPALQADSGIGPIPAGVWRIGAPITHPRLGPLAMPLTPIDFDPFGRSGFFLHGDNAAGDKSASHGCIVMGRSIRRAVVASGDTHLIVHS